MKKTKPMGLRRILAAVMTFALLVSLAPASFAEDGSGIALTAPTPERILCVVNDIMYESDTLVTEPYVEYVTDGEGERILYADYFGADGTLADMAKAQFEFMYGEIETVTDILYAAVAEVYGEFAGRYPEFAEDHPDADSLYGYVIAEYFGGNESPDFFEITEFVSGAELAVDADGYLYMYLSEFVYSADGEDVYFSARDLIAPTGAYLRPFEQFGSYRNVYEQLAAMWKAGEIGNEEALAILTGYIPDADGYLVTVAPIFRYFRDEDGAAVRELDGFDYLNGDMTVADTGLSPRDFALEASMDYFELMYSYGAEGIYGVEYELFMKYGDERVTFDRLERDAVAADIDGQIEHMREAGRTEEEIARYLVEYHVQEDVFGLPVTGFDAGYAKGTGGSGIHISEVMNADGTFVTDGFGAASVAELMEAYLAGMDTDALLKGDVNDDGRVTLADASAILKHIAGWEDVDIRADAADADDDGGADLSDVSLILRYIAGWDVAFEY